MANYYNQTPAHIRAAIEAAPAELTLAQLAEMFGVSQSTACRIRRKLGEHRRKQPYSEDRKARQRATLLANRRKKKDDESGYVDEC